MNNSKAWVRPKASDAIQSLKKAKDEFFDTKSMFVAEIHARFAELDALVSKDFTCNFTIYNGEGMDAPVELRVIHDERGSVQFLLPGEEDRLDLYRSSIVKILNHVRPNVLLEALDLFEYYAVEDFYAQIVDLEVETNELKEARNKLSS